MTFPSNWIKWSAMGLICTIAFGCSDDDDPTDPGNNDEFVFATDAPSAYSRVDRMGMPAIATAVITSKDAYNAGSPADDATGTWVTEITNNVTSLHTALDDDLVTAGLTPCAPGDCVAAAAPFVVPDVISLSTGAQGFPNGRGLTDQVIDVTLALVLLDLGTHTPTTLAELPLNPSANDKTFNSAFPYLASPHTP